ncbi:hypothetical protein ACFRAE_04290 [Sphingobacterium sp. HJSM2_6]|uniref:hypothetical protein n=1 Tax=Sphingobacterium sp. HJSM2_6 TaxID=3366264 RepID=UPI003BE5EB31
MLSKKICNLTLFCLPFLVEAQMLRCPPVDAMGNTAQKIDITAGAGVTLLYGDIRHDNNLGWGTVLKADYRVYKGLYAGLEGQIGQLRAVGENNPLEAGWDPRGVINRPYIAGMVNLTVYPYRFFINERMLFRESGFEKFVLNGLYVGVGFGGIFNNYSDVVRGNTFTYTNNQGNSVTRTFPEGAMNGPVDGGNDWLLPVANVGISIPLNKYSSYYRNGYFSFVANSQFNFSRGEDLDGYNPIDIDTGEPTSKYNDMYNFTYLGLKYTF